MPVDYFMPTEHSYAERRAWYPNPWFYVPVVLVVVALVAWLIAFLSLAASLQQPAATLDLAPLEKQHSARHIVARTSKTIGNL